jgi:hypothetical protein
MAEPAIGERTVLARRREIAWRSFEGEVIMVVTARDEIGHLNPVASFIWEALDGSTDLAGIAGRLEREFAVGRDEALEDTLAFASELLEKGMVEVVG